MQLAWHPFCDRGCATVSVAGQHQLVLAVSWLDFFSGDALWAAAAEYLPRQTDRGTWLLFVHVMSFILCHVCLAGQDRVRELISCIAACTHGP